MKNVPSNCRKARNNAQAALKEGRFAEALSFLLDARDACDTTGESRTTTPELEMMRGVAWREFSRLLRGHRDQFAWVNVYPTLFEREGYSIWTSDDISVKLALELSLKCLTKAHNLTSPSNWFKLKTVDDSVLFARILRERALTNLLVNELYSAQQDIQQAIQQLRSAQNMLGGEHVTRLNVELNIDRALRVMLRHVQRGRQRVERSSTLDKLTTYYGQMVTSGSLGDEDTLQWTITVGLWRMQVTPSFVDRTRLAGNLMQLVRNLPKTQRLRPMRRIVAASYGVRRFP